MNLPIVCDVIQGRLTLDWHDFVVPVLIAAAVGLLAGYCLGSIQATWDEEWDE